MNAANLNLMRKSSSKQNTQGTGWLVFPLTSLHHLFPSILKKLQGPSKTHQYSSKPHTGQFTCSFNIVIIDNCTHLLFTKHHSTMTSCSAYLNPARACHWELESQNRGDTTILTIVWHPPLPRPPWKEAHTVSIESTTVMLRPVLCNLVQEADMSSGPTASLRTHTSPTTLPLEDPSGLAGEGELPAQLRITESLYTRQLGETWVIKISAVSSSPLLLSILC